MKSIDFEILKEEVVSALKQSNTIVLATCSNNRVTARHVYFASEEFKVLFVTSKAYDKYKQIEKNNNVALCLDNIQIEGIATIKGHPDLPENSVEKQICLTKCKSKFERYFRYKNTVLIQIDIHFVKAWNKKGRECLDIKSQEAYRIG